MHDAAAGGHPVHLAGADRHRGAETIAVHDLAVEQVADRGEPDMRVRPHVQPLAAAEFGRAEMVEKDEGADHARAHRRQGTAHGEAVAEVRSTGDDHIGERVAGIGVAGLGVCAGGETHDGSSVVGLKPPAICGRRQPQVQRRIGKVVWYRGGAGKCLKQYFPQWLRLKLNGVFTGSMAL